MAVYCILLFWLAVSSGTVKHIDTARSTWCHSVKQPVERDHRLGKRLFFGVRPKKKITPIDHLSLQHGHIDMDTWPYFLLQYGHISIITWPYMNKQRNITIKVLVSGDEKERIEHKAEGKPLSQYLRDVSLEDKSPSGGFAGESGKLGDEGDTILKEMTERFGSLAQFMDRLVHKLDVAGDKSVYKWLEEEGKGKPEASHPYFGWTVAMIKPEMMRVLVTSGGREVPISSEVDNEELLVWFFDEDGEPYYKVGEVIGREVPFKGK